MALRLLGVAQVVFEHRAARALAHLVKVRLELRRITACLLTPAAKRGPLLRWRLFVTILLDAGCAAPAFKTIAPRRLPEVTRLLKVVACGEGSAAPEGAADPIVRRIVLRGQDRRLRPYLERLQVNGHVHAQVFDAPDRFLPGQCILAVVDLGRIGTQIAPSGPDFEVLALVQYGLLALSCFLIRC